MTERVWYCRIRNREIGPLSRQQVRKLLRTGELSLSDEIRKFESDAWQKVAVVVKQPEKNSTGEITPQKDLTQKQNTGWSLWQVGFALAAIASVFILGVPLLHNLWHSILPDRDLLTSSPANEMPMDDSWRHDFSKFAASFKLVKNGNSKVLTAPSVSKDTSFEWTLPFIERNESSVVFRILGLPDKVTLDFNCDFESAPEWDTVPKTTLVTFRGRFTGKVSEIQYRESGVTGVGLIYHINDVCLSEPPPADPRTASIVEAMKYTRDYGADSVDQESLDSVAKSIPFELLAQIANPVSDDDVEPLIREFHHLNSQRGAIKLLAARGDTASGEVILSILANCPDSVAGAVEEALREMRIDGDTVCLALVDGVIANPLKKNTRKLLVRHSQTCVLPLVNAVNNRMKTIDRPARIALLQSVADLGSGAVGAVPGVISTATVADIDLPFFVSKPRGFVSADDVRAAVAETLAAIGDQSDDVISTLYRMTLNSDGKYEKAQKAAVIALTELDPDGELRLKIELSDRSQ